MAYDILPPKEIIDKTLNSLKERGIAADFARDKNEAFVKLKNLIPAGAELMTAGSTTLEQIGFIPLLQSGSHPWKNLKDEILAEKDPAKQTGLRRKSTLSQYFIGSVHAVTEGGEVLVASASGSQLSAYAYSSPNVIWVMGAQKIVPTLEDGLRRLWEYSLPLEDKRMKSIGKPGSFMGRILIFERENSPNRKISMILVNEVLGF